MKKKNSFAAVGISLFLSLLLVLPVRASKNDRINDSQFLTEKVEKAITRASDMFEQGNIIKGRPYVVHISSRLLLSFSAENFDNDLDKAFKVLDTLMTQAKKETQLENAPRNNKNTPKPLRTKPVSSKNVPPPDRISALMQAEGQHPKPRKLTAREVPLQFSAFKNYNALHQGRAMQEDKAAEADMQAVNRERQSAEEELRQRRARKQQVQLQAMNWQNELDKEASESARKAAAYEAEHSFGAYVKGFFTTILQTAVGSFTGAFIGNIGTHLADKAVNSLFHNSSSSLNNAASVGTSSAINATTSTTSQAISNSVSSSASNTASNPSSKYTKKRAVAY